MNLYDSDFRNPTKCEACLLIFKHVTLLLLTSLTVLSLDYWSKEHAQGNPTWLLAQRIQRETPADARIISITGGDPTLLPSSLGHP